jgi:hypothetical protein
MFVLSTIIATLLRTSYYGPDHEHGTKALALLNGLFRPWDNRSKNACVIERPKTLDAKGLRNSVRVMLCGRIA